MHIFGKNIQLILDLSVHWAILLLAIRTFM